MSGLEGEGSRQGETRTKDVLSEKRRQQNRAAQKTYREKRKRKLQELEALTASRDQPDLNIERAIHQSTALGNLTPQCSTQPTQGETRTIDENPDWLFEFISPPAIENVETASPIPKTTSVTYILHFASQPTASERESLARVVFASYTRNPTSRPPFNPYLNTLTVSALSFAKAFFANTLHLGLVQQAYCNSTAQSHFYRPMISDSPYAESMLLAVQRSFDGLKHDLRPISTQITHSHHPAFDIFPFPSLRKRLIEALSQTPPLVNELEFWQDVAADGIVCWGNVSAELSGGGVPWDARSWEAKPWFLDKYVGVLGEEDDELWKGSRWWREMRGEFM